ncbi:MAG: type IV pilus modification protein PilV [Gammaproteobacteria bacterium]
MSRFFYNSLCSRQQGFTIIEILVTIVILSIGLLGIAGLQLTGLRANHSAYSRTQVSLLASDMAERLSANLQGVAAGNYDSITIKPADPQCISTAAGCTSAQMAQYDAFEWLTSLGSVLPSGIGTVSGAGAGSTFTITVMWDDTRSGATGTGCDANNPADLKCFQMLMQP